jgi:hypothetical protein
MKRLEDIPKDPSFKVPEGYFDELPMRIQARVQENQNRPAWISNYSVALKFALPIVFIGIISVVLWTNRPAKEDVFTRLDSVPTEDLLAYLESDEITTEEIIENASFENTTLNSLYPQEEELAEEELDELTKQYDFNF